MKIALIILAILICVLLLFLSLQRKELRRIKNELHTIRNQNSNGTIHSELDVQELKELIGEINVLLTTSRDTNIAYERQNSRLRKMITNISHDLRTPLTSALGYIDMILHSPMPEEEKLRELTVIQSRLYRMEELLNSFFEFSKFISQDKKPDLAAVNLIGVLEESIIHFYDDFSREGRQIIFHHSENNFKIYSHKEMLTRIFDNIISNARKHSTGNLTIDFHSLESGYRITFSNDLGEEEPDVEHIFDEFYTMDSSHSNGNTGLGLAIAREFSQALGMSISARTENQQLYITLEKSKKEEEQP